MDGGQVRECPRRVSHRDELINASSPLLPPPRLACTHEASSSLIVFVCMFRLMAIRLPSLLRAFRSLNHRHAHDHREEDVRLVGRVQTLLLSLLPRSRPAACSHTLFKSLRLLACFHCAPPRPSLPRFLVFFLMHVLVHVLFSFVSFCSASASWLSELLSELSRWWWGRVPWRIPGRLWRHERRLQRYGAPSPLSAAHMN